MSYSTAQIWLIIAGLGIGTFVIRFSFLGMIGSRDMPEWLLRHLRYAAVAVLPGLVAPLVLWPAATGGEPELARTLAAIMALTMGYLRRSALWGMGAGIVTLYCVIALRYLAGF